jgi:hypothetical protein
MYRLADRLKAIRLQSGFSMVEVLVSGVVLVVGLVMLSQFFASSAARVLESDVRSVLDQVAAQEIDRIRGLDYSQVGTEHGWPVGDLVDDETIMVDVNRVRVQRQVIFWTDASDSRGASAPASYRRVTVKVSAVDHPALDPVEIVSNIAGGSTGGNILVKVQDSKGEPVEGAQFTITNDVLIPRISITSLALRTNAVGSMLVQALTVDPDGNYVVEASKSGYSTDSKTDFAVLADTLQEVVLTIDLLSSMNVRVLDQNGAEVIGMQVVVTGPQGFSQTVTSQDGGVALTGLRFSTSAEPYILKMLAANGYAGQLQTLALPAGSTKEVVFYAGTQGSTTTTTVGAGTTTTTVGSATTTTLGTGGSLLVTVVTDGPHGHVPLRYAWVNLGGMTGYTNRDGQVPFQNLAWGTYDINVTMDRYATYTSTVTIDGADTLSVELIYNGGSSHPH